MNSVPLTSWPDRLQQVIEAQCSLFTRVTVLRETVSTQDAAKRMQARPGHVVTTWRQVAGRGRLGRAWADTAEHGVAVTLAVAKAPPEMLAIASAIGVAETVETLLTSVPAGQPADRALEVGIKWPNDIMVNGSKLAGILIEQSGDTALVGIGLNVGQAVFDGPLASRAVSLWQLGSRADRLDVLSALIPAVDRAFRLDEAELAARYTRRDVMRGTVATFRSGESVVTGHVVAVDPLRGIRVRTGEGEVDLPGATTTVVPRQ